MNSCRLLLTLAGGEMIMRYSCARLALRADKAGPPVHNRPRGSALQVFSMVRLLSTTDDLFQSIPA